MIRNLTLATSLLFAICISGQNPFNPVQKTPGFLVKTTDKPYTGNKKDIKAYKTFDKGSIKNHEGMPLFLSGNEKSQAYMSDSVITSEWLDQEWKPFYKITNTYSLGRLDTSISYIFTEGKWFFRDMSIFAYNNSGNLSAKTTFLWKNNNWVESIRLSLSYHPNQEVEKEVELTYISPLTSWDTTRFGLYNDQSYTLLNFYKAYNSETGLAEWGTKYDYEYNSADSSLYIQMGWEPGENEWNNLSSNFNRLASDTHSALEITKNWANNAWINNYYTERQYDANMNLIQYLEKSGLNANNWKNEYKNQYYYSNNLQDSSIYAHGINTTSWQNSMKTSNTYNSEGNLILESNFNWNLQTNHWENSGKKELYYNINELTDSTLSSFWDNFLNKFVPSNREYFTYNELNQLTEKISHNWSVWDSIWENFERYQYWYQNNGTHTLFQTWFNQDWMPYSENASYSNEEGLNTEFYSMYFNEGVPSYGYRGLTEYTEYGLIDSYITQQIDANLGEWVNEYYYKYHYSLHETAGIAANIEKAKWIFPNPVKAGQFVKLKTDGEGFVKISNLSGISLHKQILNPEGQLLIPSNFAPGQYLISFTGKKDNVQKHFKLIVE